MEDSRGEKIACQTATHMFIKEDWLNSVNPPDMPESKKANELKKKYLDLVRHAFCVGVVLASTQQPLPADAVALYQGMNRKSA